jgi:serine/threonine protein kinase/Tol biopolymer transport system component
VSTHWGELDRIFSEARQLPAGEQAAFIASACGANAELRAEAESLLSASNESRDFMEMPAIERLAQLFASDGLALQPGRRIGAYTIVEQLGFGGAGEVWRAKDERLDRDVAIKVLLPHLATDTEKMRRFGEEARAAGKLNHPNILIVHDVGEHDGKPYLVSECLEGRNLRERLKTGPVPPAEAIAIALGIAHGLAAAHEHGIVHRDLKPENTFLKKDGSIKLLDFGLAKLKQPVADPRSDSKHTAVGVIAGTAGYMAPEQARGESFDPRSDLFALGAMMYEMLAGQHPFRGASVFETLHAILSKDPDHLSTVSERVPPALAQIVMRLLQKAPEARFQSARDLAWSLAQVTAGSALPAAPQTRASPTAGRRRSQWPWLAVPLATLWAMAAGWWLSGETPQARPAPPLTRFAWTLPAGMSLDSPPAVAPDGRRIAFTGSDATSVRLFVRDLESVDARVVAGTDGAMLPFWSPDGRSLGYFSGDRLMKVSLPDGAPAAVAEAPHGRGGAWTTSGVILYGPDLIMAGLQRVPVEGGNAEPATLLDPSRGETSHQWPIALPDGVHFLYFVRSVDAARRGIYVGRVDGPATRAGEPLFHSDSGVVYVPVAGSREAELFYALDGRVEVRRFDPETLAAAPDARAIGFLPHETSAVPVPIMASASADVMAFAESPIPSGNRLASFSMGGERVRTWDEPVVQNWPRVSPDGRLLARAHMDDTQSQPDIWVEDLERGTVYPVTRTLEPEMAPVWSPNGRQLAFVTGHLPGRRGYLQLNIAAADGTGIVRSQPCPGDYCEPTDWSKDGSSLLVTVLEADNPNVWIVSTGPDGTAKPLLTAEFSESDARFSPDGRWVAYVSREAGRPEVWVRTVSGAPRRMVVSGEGGAQPVWSRDGKLIYFVDLQGQLRSASVSWGANGDPVFGLPDLPKLPPIGFGHWGTQYDVSPDDSRIYFIRPNDDPAPREIQVVLGWRALLD